VLDEIDDANARIHGYGSQSFGRKLRQCYERLMERAIGDEDLVTVMGFAERILERPIELIDGVRSSA
jgi:putative hydrolase of the HAD superfamily